MLLFTVAGPLPATGVCCVLTAPDWLLAADIGRGVARVLVCAPELAVWA
jgi:hypothetical protein